MSTLRLENEALAAEFAEGVLRLTNKLSGSVAEMACPGFALGLRGEVLEGADFSPTSATAGAGEVVLGYRHEPTGIAAEVRYWLTPGEAWLRKQVTLQAPGALPTPDRLWVDRQRVAGPVRRVGYGVRGGLDAEEITGLETYAGQPGCGYPVYAGEWFAGLEHPTGFAVPQGGRLELFQHPTWGEAGRIVSFPAVWGAAASHEAAPQAFMDYLWRIRNPRLERPLTMITVGWSTQRPSSFDYIDTFEIRDRFVDAMLELGLRPRLLGIDAGWFDRASMYHAKADDDQDSRLIAFRERLQAAGMELAIWVSHNGPVGLDMDWVQAQGWEIGQGPGCAYSWHDYVVMMQPDFEDALAQRWEQIVGRVGAVHLKMDWDNECATNPSFAERSPTVDHVREASVLAFNRIDRRLRAANPDLKTRHGWWPSPWWLQHADHVWLVDSGDGEYEAWPSRTARDRDATHRDAMYHHLQRVSETPMPLDAYDNHGFADTICNPFTTERHTWLNTCVLSALRGTTYIHYPLTPEGLRDWQAEMMQQVLEWWDAHGAELGTRDTRMVLGSPGAGEIYGFLHPHADGAWLMLRNPSVEPQAVQLALPEWLGYEPGSVRQVFPYWTDPGAELWLLGHEVRVLDIRREAQPALPWAEFIVRGPGEWLMPGNVPRGEVGPTVAPEMQIPALAAELLSDEATASERSLKLSVTVPYRMEQAELLVTLRGPEEALDGITVRGGTSRYLGDAIRDYAPVTRVFRGIRGYGTSRVLPALGPRDRDDYVLSLPDGGMCGVGVELVGPRAAEVEVALWVTGYEAPARQTVVGAPGLTGGSLLPGQPYGFPRFVKVL